jgi:hypothetical protein
MKLSTKKSRCVFVNQSARAHCQNRLASLFDLQGADHEKKLRPLKQHIEARTYAGNSQGPVGHQNEAESQNTRVKVEAEYKSAILPTQTSEDAGANQEIDGVNHAGAAAMADSTTKTSFITQLSEASDDDAVPSGPRGVQVLGGLPRHTKSPWMVRPLARRFLQRPHCPCSFEKMTSTARSRPSCSQLRLRFSRKRGWLRFYSLASVAGYVCVALPSVAGYICVALANVAGCVCMTLADVAGYVCGALVNAAGCTRVAIADVQAKRPLGARDLVREMATSRTVYAHRDQ